LIDSFIPCFLTKSKETRNDILILDIFKSLIPTFGLVQWVKIIKECLLKVRIKLLKISYVEYHSLFPYFL